MTIPEVRGCWSCKASVPGTVTFCPRCGARLVLSWDITVNGKTERLDCAVLTVDPDPDAP